MRAFRTDNGVTSNRRLSLSYVSIGNYDAIDFIEACRGLGWMDIGITAVCDNSETLNQDVERFEDLLDGVRGSDLCIIKIHGDRSYFPKFQTLLDTAAGCRAGMLLYSNSAYETEDFRRRFPFPDDDYMFVLSLLRIGGVKNYTTLCLWACRKLSGLDVMVPGLDRVPSQGVYSPPCLRSGPVAEGRPRVGVMMSHMMWRHQESQCIDLLCERLEALGLDVIPVYFKSQRDLESGSQGVIGSVRRYFMKGRRPIVDAIAVCRGFSQTILGSDDGGVNPFEIVGVPAVQCPTVYSTPDLWERDYMGLSSTELSASCRQPEIDGQIDGVPLQFVQGRGESRVCTPEEDRVDRIAGMMAAWCSLRRKPRSEARIAIALNAAPDGSLGTSRGLSPLESTRRVLSALRRRGYSVDVLPKTQRELARMLGIASGSSDRCPAPEPVDPGLYRSWLKDLPGFLGDKVEMDHGAPDTEDLSVGGIVDGNVYIGIEPPADVGPHGGVSHAFLAFYRWVEEVFSADAIVHMGDHGQLERLPGKMSGLSSSCWPDAILRSSVNICPFAIDDPGNAVVAKRRTHAVVIGHMVPSESAYGIPEDMRSLESLMQSCMEAAFYDGKPIVSDMELASELMDRLDFWGEVGLDRDCSSEDLFHSAPVVFDRISRLKSERIPDGLHVLGESLEGEGLVEAVSDAVSVPNGDVPSIGDALPASRFGDPAAAVGTMSRFGFDREACIAGLGAEGDDRAEGFIGFVCDRLVPGLRSCSDEISNLLSALEGHFIPPGPGGSPFRGCVEVLPPGRNICAIDPECMPTREGWATGCRAAEETASRFASEFGRPLGTVAVFVTGGGSLANGGAELAAAMRLAGLRPAWSSADGTLVSMERMTCQEGDVRVRLCMTPAMERIFGRFLSLFRVAIGYDPLESTGTEEDAVIAGRGMYERGSDEAIRHGRVREGRDSGGSAMYLMSGHGMGSKVQSPKEEASSLVRTRLSNPGWVTSMAGCSTDGVAEIRRNMAMLLALGGIPGSTEPWMFHRVCGSLVIPDDIIVRMTEDHPAAVCDIIGMLSQAASEGLWSPDPDESEAMSRCYLAAESALEGIGTGRGLEDGERRAPADRQGCAHRRDRGRDVPPARRRREQRSPSDASRVHPSQVQGVLRQGGLGHSWSHPSDGIQVAEVLERRGHEPLRIAGQEREEVPADPGAEGGCS